MMACLPVSDNGVVLIVVTTLTVDNILLAKCELLVVFLVVSGIA
jgi:hypothetical protein